MISICIATYNRKKLLEQCYNNVLQKTSALTREIKIWNNGSSDGTKDFLESLAQKDTRLKITHHNNNIGVNAMARITKTTKYNHIITLDDDVIDAPNNWDKILFEAYNKLPEIKYLSSFIVDDGKGSHARYMFRERKIQNEKTVKKNGFELILGSSGGWCSITDRAAYDEVGGLKENANFAYWQEDTLFKRDLMKRGYQTAILKSLRVFHASGPYYLNDKNIQKEKSKYFNSIKRKKKIQTIKHNIKETFTHAWRTFTHAWRWNKNAA